MLTDDDESINRNEVYKIESTMNSTALLIEVLIKKMRTLESSRSDVSADSHIKCNIILNLAFSFV